jgi:hypothetical protein
MKVINENAAKWQPEAQHILRAVLVITLIVGAALLRIAPHPFNFAPIGAMALFAGAMIRTRWMALALPLVALLAGDIFIGFHKLMFVVYTSFAVSVVIGRWLARSRSVMKLGGAVFLGALQFFLVTNFALWALGGFYPQTGAGLAACYLAGIPYFCNTLAGDIVYSAVLFGGYALAERWLALPVEHGTADVAD